MLAPLLVSSVGIFCIIARYQIKQLEVPAAFIFCFAGVFYSFVVGVLLHLSAEVAFGLLNWINPLLLGAHIAIDWPIANET